MNELAVTADEVLARLSDQARANIACFLKVAANGSISFDLLSPEARNHLYLIKKIRMKRRRKIAGHAGHPEAWEHEWLELEMYDAQAALELLGKHHRLFSGQLEMAGWLSIEGLDAMLDKAYGKHKSQR